MWKTLRGINIQNKIKSSNAKWEVLSEKISKFKRKAYLIPKDSELIKMLIAGEDHRFKFHNGIDIIALIRAMWKTLILKKREGGSTIAMQLVRVLTSNYEKTIERKLEEMILAYKLTKHVSKQEILSLYLSVAYFGWNMHGISQACKVLKLNLHDLTIEESASLIARLKYPEPKNISEQRSSQIKSRADYIIRRYKTLEIKNNYVSF